MENSIKCPSCKGNSIHTEGGIAVTCQFKNGKKEEETQCHLPTRIFCNDCYFEFSIEVPEAMSHEDD